MRDIVFSRAELLHRMRERGFVLSHARRMLRETWALISPAPFDTLYRRVRGMTMVSHARLRSLHDSVRHIVGLGIEGDIVECGVARGGSAAVMALTLQDCRASRTLWLFDTFAGIPEATADDPDYDIARNYTRRFKGNVERIRADFVRLGVTVPVQFCPGLFQQTLAPSPVQRIALLHVDGDWYDSVKTTLEAMYDRVVPGGIIQFDDYGHWLGARKAIDEFLRVRGIRAEIEYIDFAGRSMVKPS